MRSSTLTDMKNDETTAHSAHAGGFRRQRSFSRACALQFLCQLDANQQYPFDEDCWLRFMEQINVLALADDADDRIDIVPKGWAYAKTLAEGTCAHRDTIDAALLAAASNWSLSRMGLVDRNILRLGVYEIIHVDKVSAATAINEAVELAKRFAQADSPRFINGVLDHVRATSEITPDGK